MRDKQAYLEAAEAVDGILYTSSSLISGDDSEASITTEYVSGITKNGDRVVNISDVVSTIYRYSKEKYGVTIVKNNGTVISRFDSNTASLIQQYNNIKSGLDEYKEVLEKNTKTIYSNPEFDTLEELYRITVEGNSNINYGAPWYGNNEEINERIKVELNGGTYEYNKQKYKRDEGLIEILNNATKIVEVTNEIDNSKYLEDSNLLQQYQMPTVEIIYIVY
jgi:hypothetical protein